MKLTPRHERTARWTIACYALAMLAFLGLSGLLVLSVGGSPRAAFAALLNGAAGNRAAIGNTLAKATPLVFTGLAAALAFRARIWSIGQEGQMVFGAITGYGAVVWFGLSGPAGILVALAAGMAGGAMLGLVSGFLDVRFRVNVIISTVLLNYCAGYLLSWLLQPGLWGEVGQTVSYQQSATLADGLRLPPLPGLTKVHMGAVLALILALIVGITLRWTRLGFEIRGFGLNPRAMVARGVDAGRLVMVVMAGSGALAGLAGLGQILGESHRLRPDALAGLGYTGIVVALIGRNSATGTLIAALFFGGLAAGGLTMRVAADIPSSLVTAMQGIALIAFLLAEIASGYQLVRAPREKGMAA